MTKRLNSTHLNSMRDLSETLLPSYLLPDPLGLIPIAMAGNLRSSRPVVNALPAENSHARHGRAIECRQLAVSPFSKSADLTLTVGARLWGSCLKFLAELTIWIRNVAPAHGISAGVVRCAVETVDEDSELDRLPQVPGGCMTSVFIGGAASNHLPRMDKRYIACRGCGVVGKRY